MEEVTQDEVQKLQLQLSGARALNEELRLSAKEEWERLQKLLAAANEEIDRLRNENRSLEAKLIDHLDERPPETPRDGAQLCQEPGCKELAEYSYVWPDTNTRYYGCARHAQAAAVTVSMMGRELVLEPVSRVVVE